MKTLYDDGVVPRSRVGMNLVSFHNSDIETDYVKELYLRQLDIYAQYTQYIGYLEFSHVACVSPEEGAVIGDHARDLGLIPWSIHSEHLNVGDTVENYLSIQTHEAEVCAALGCQVMVCHLPNLRPYVDFERDLDVIGRVADIAHAHGVRLAVETCFYKDEKGVAQPDYELLIKVVNNIDREDVGFTLDTGHCLFSSTHQNPDCLKAMQDEDQTVDLTDIVRKLGSKLFTTHLQDNFGLNDDHQAPGMGCLNWHRMVPAILATGYQGPLMMELTGMGVKSRRTVPQLRRFPLEKEIVFGASYLQFILQQHAL